MHRSVPLAIVLGVALSLFGVSTVLAHEGDGEEKILVEPSSLTAGSTIILAGSGLEPDNERVLLLAGQDLVVEFGTVRTDAQGMFQQELLIPGHLPSGTYEVRAIGDETLAVPLAVTAAAGADAPPATAEDQMVAVRARSPIELGILLAFVALTALAGVLLVWRAERFRGMARP